MEERSSPPMPHGSLWDAGRRGSGAGIAAGFLLLTGSGLLPERMRLAFACSGIALALLSASVLVLLTAHPMLRWRGVSPALGIVLGVAVGAVPGLLSGAWLRSENHPVPRTASVRFIASPRNEVRPATTMPVAPQERVGVAAARPGRPPAAVESELAYLVDSRARPAVDSLQRLLTSLADAPDATDPATLRVQLEPSVNELTDVAASLERIESENSELTPELRAAIAGGRPLSALNVSLHQLTVAQGDARGYGARRLRRLAGAADSASRWLDNVDQLLTRGQVMPDGSQ